MVNKDNYNKILAELNASKTQLVAVSKLKPIEDLQEMYDLGQRDFGENYVQELLEKQAALPADIRWHFIGHLQSNKVKYIAPFVHLIHGVDSFSLLKEINKQAEKNNRIISCLLQVHIAEEETKYGLDEKEALAFMEMYTAQQATLQHIRIDGLMGMASFSEDEVKVRSEFKNLKALFKIIQQSYFLASDHFGILSMGMSGDYAMAVEEGSNLVRIGSLLFGNR